MPRIQMPAAGDLSPAQAEACAEVSSGPRGKVPAPMIAWLRNPELARRGQKLGELLRYSTTLADDQVELAIVVCARHWTSHVEWNAHKVYALKAGVDPAAVAAIAARRDPVLPDARLRVVYDIASTLLAKGRLPAPLYAKGSAQLGEQGLVELVAVLGYYCFVSLTLNTFELGLPEAAAPELEDPEFPGSP